MANYAPDVVSFDVVSPLQKVARKARRRRTEERFSRFEGRLGYEIRYLSDTTAEDVAFCHSLNQVKGTKTDGKKIEIWVACDCLLPQHRRQMDGHARACLGTIQRRALRRGDLEDLVGLGAKALAFVESRYVLNF